MVNISIDVTDLGGEARPGDKVVLWKPAAAGSSSHAGRVISTAPVDVFLTNGKASVPDVEPGEMRVLLQCRGVESQGPIDVTVPDGTGTVTLRSLIESQFEYAPPIVSAVQEAAANASASEEAAIRAQVRSEAAADRADAKVDDAINNGAALVRDEVKQDADRAVSARQAAVQSESNAKASEGKAAASESNAKASESAAKQSETNAGDYAAVSTTAATEAVDAMESASDAASSIGNSVTEAAGHADRAAQHESGAASSAQIASDAADRVGTAEQVGTWAQQAQDAADRIGTAGQVETWAQQAVSSASNASASEYAAKQSETNASTHEANSLSAAERAEFAAEETIQQVEGDFATRNYVDSTKWDRGHVPLEAMSLSALPLGSLAVSNAVRAGNIGTPGGRLGNITIGAIGASKTALFISQGNAAEKPGMWINSQYSGAWQGWQQVSPVDIPESDVWYKGFVEAGHETLNDLSVGAWAIAARNHAARFGLPMDFGSLQIMQISSSRTAFFIGQSTGLWVNSSNGDVWGEWQQISESSDGNIQAGAVGLKTVAMSLTAGSYTDGVAGRYRVLAQATAPVLRWRIHVESHRMLSNTTSAFTLGDVYIGSHSGNGAMTGQQQIKSGNLSVPADSEWVSPWLDAALLANETLIDVDVAGSELYRSQATSWVYEGGSWVISKSSPVAIWVELETYDQVPVVGMIGDSTGCGQGADRPVFDSALYIAARKHKFIPMAYTYPGSSMQSINNYDFHIFQRWAHLDKPDSVIIQSGSNDIHLGTSTAELQTRFADLVETAELISPVVIGATVKARYPNSGDYQAALDAHNNFVRSRANGNRDYLDFYQALSPTGTVAAADAADAAHLTTSGHQKLATAFDSVTVARPAWVDTANELDAKADKSYVDKRVPIDSFTGTGSPEGKVAAPVGSVYTDSAATNGAIRWVKVSGTGATGWRVEYGNTGVRNITSLIEGDTGTGVARIQRVGNTVMLAFNNIPTPGTGTFMSIPNFIPVGFRSAFNWQHLGVGKAAGIDAAGPVRVGTNGDLYIYRTSSETRINGTVTYISDTPWPATLPGTPA